MRECMGDEEGRGRGVDRIGEGRRGREEEAKRECEREGRTDGGAREWRRAKVSEGQGREKEGEKEGD